MATADPTFLYLGTYQTAAAARADYNALKDPLSTLMLRTYDAALVTKDTSGAVHVNKDDVMKRHGTWGGAVTGAMVGILFHPRSSPPPRSAARPARSVATSGEGYPARM